jgi:hypothetical protein
MNIRHLVSPRPRALVVLVSALVVWASIAAIASAAPDKKTFTTSVGPNPLIAGRTYSVAPFAPLVFTITNTSNSAMLGSVNVTVPAGIIATAVSSNATLVGTTIQLRNLDLSPQGSTNVLVWSLVECGSDHAPYVWTTVAKQSNDFNGTGNDLKGNSPTSTISGSCSLIFSKQPKHAAKAPVAITNKIYDPSGDPVTVTVLDGAGVQTVTWWSGTIVLTLGDDPTGSASLTGGLSGSPSGGSATFTPSIDLSGTGYSLIATATPTAGTASVGTSSAGVESASFNIVDDASICDATPTNCNASAGHGKTEAMVQATTGGTAGDLVILSIADPTVDVHCPGYNDSSDVVVFNITHSDGVTPAQDRAKTASLKLIAPSKSASKYQVCYDNGVLDPYLLPNCGPNQGPACILSKGLDRDKNLVIVISAPAGDPAVKF